MSGIVGKDLGHTFMSLASGDVYTARLIAMFVNCGVFVRHYWQRCWSRDIISGGIYTSGLVWSTVVSRAQCVIGLTVLFKTHLSNEVSHLRHFLAFFYLLVSGVLLPFEEVNG